MGSPFRLDFAVDDDDDLQRLLNDLYGYADDLSTKVHHRNRLNLFSVLLERLVREGVVESLNTALDVGCNAGIYSKLLSDRGFRSVLGIDVDAQKIEQARKAFELRETGRSIVFDQMNAEEVGGLGTFDLVLCTEVIEHTERPEQVIDSIAAAVAPGGVAVISLPNALSLPFLLIRLTRMLTRQPVDQELRAHLQYPSYRSIHLFDGRPFARVATTGTNLVLSGPLIRLLYGRRLFPLVNRLNFWLAAGWPLKYASQFFFLVLKKDDPSRVARQQRLLLREPRARVEDTECGSSRGWARRPEAMSAADPTASAVHRALCPRYPGSPCAASSARSD